MKPTSTGETMSDSNGLAVGLAVGIPTFLVVVIVGVFWIRNHRKQRQEDLIEDDIDIGLKDDQSFQQFEQELHKPIHPVNDSNGSSTLTDNSHQQPHNNNPKFNNNQKTYDFYNTFIPVLNDTSKNDESFHDSGFELSQASLLINNNHNTFNNNNNNNDTSHNGSILLPPSIHLNQSPSAKSLDSLAKNLSTPQFFEKLPSKTQPLQIRSIKNSNHNILSNNSSSDVLQNDLFGDQIRLNESYAYTANAVEIKLNTSPKKSVDLKSTNDIQSKSLNIVDNNPHHYPDPSDFVSLPPSEPSSPTRLEEVSVRSSSSSPFHDNNHLDTTADTSDTPKP